MGLLEFSKLPINTLVGADWKTFNQITKVERSTRHIKENIASPKRYAACFRP